MIYHYLLDSFQNIKKYQKILERVGKNPYYTIEYLDSFGGGIDNASFFVYENPKTEALIIMLGYIRNIGANNSDYKDFISPYGYQGPLSLHAGIEDFEIFWKELNFWYKENNVISEFIRFSLFENYVSYNGQLVPTLLNIKGRILEEEEEQWMNFDRKVRKNVKRAKKSNLVSKIYFGEISESVIGIFYEIYNRTMKRTKAHNDFFYSFSDFSGFIKKNPELCAICVVYDNVNEPIASELILISENVIYSFLGGTLENHFDKRPNDFLKFEIINWARKNNFNYFVLGGGYGKEDGIYKYKKTFFPNEVVTYYTGRKIINDSIYNELVNLCNQQRKNEGLQALPIEDKSFFPLYRKLN